MVELLGKHSSRKSSRCLAKSVLRRLARIHRETIDILSIVKGSNLKKFAVMARLVCVLHMEREVMSSSKQRGRIANGHIHTRSEKFGSFTPRKVQPSASSSQDYTYIPIRQRKLDFRPQGNKIIHFSDPVLKKITNLFRRRPRAA